MLPSLFIYCIHIYIHIFLVLLYGDFNIKITTINQSIINKFKLFSYESIETNLSYVMTLLRATGLLLYFVIIIIIIMPMIYYLEGVFYAFSIDCYLINIYIRLSFI